MTTASVYGVGAGVYGGPTLNPPIPAGTTAGMGLICAFTADASGGFNITPPTGVGTWTPLLSGFFLETDDGQSMKYYWRMATGSEPASETWTSDQVKTGAKIYACQDVAASGPVLPAGYLKGSYALNASGSQCLAGAIDIPFRALELIGYFPDAQTASKEWSGIFAGAGYTDSKTDASGSLGYGEISLSYKNGVSQQSTGVVVGTSTAAVATPGVAGWLTIHFYWPDTNAIAVTAQPLAQAADAGGTATFSATSTGATSYQWQSAAVTDLYSNIPGTWSNISGATSATYTTGTLSAADNGTWFRRVDSNSSDTVTTSPARLWISGLGVSGKGSIGGATGPFGAWLFRRISKRLARDSMLRQRQGTGDPDNTEAIVWGDWLGIAASGAFAAAATDAITAADTADSLLTAGSSASDSVTATDAAALAGPVSISASDAIAATDATSAQAVMVATGSDAAAAIDAATTQTTVAAVATDAAAATDASAAQAALAVAATDAVTATDAGATQMALGVSATDAASAIDAATTQSTAGAIASDAASSSDSASISTGAVLSASDAASAGDAAATQVVDAAAATDAVSAGDSADVVVIRAASASDAATAGDSAAAQLTLPASATDTVTAADAAALDAAGAATANDAVSAADVSLAVGAFGAVAADSVTLSDSALAVAVLLAAVTDAIAASDQATSSASGGGTIDPAAVWAYVLANGLTAEATLLETQRYVLDLARIHGLVLGEPLVVTPSTRAAGPISQTLSDVAGTITVTRLP